MRGTYIYSRLKIIEYIFLIVINILTGSTAEKKNQATLIICQHVQVTYAIWEGQVI